MGKQQLFKPGQSGNPAGRPKGTRNKVTEAFLRDLKSTWDEFGVEALKIMAQKNPAEFVRVVAKLVPRDVNLKHEAGDNFIECLREMQKLRKQREQTIDVDAIVVDVS